MRVAEEAIVLLDQAANVRRQQSLAFLECCESPVEQILVAAILARWSTWGAAVNPRFNRVQCVLVAPYPASWDGLFHVLVEVQKPLRTAESRYRCDLYLSLTRFTHVPKYPEWGKLVVEVDGHDFHDRTKEQASHDRHRDRALVREGLTVIRFTGSDVYNDAGACVEEIWEQMALLADQVFQQFRSSGRHELLGGSSR